MWRKTHAQYQTLTDNLKITDAIVCNCKRKTFASIAKTKLSLFLARDYLMAIPCISNRASNNKAPEPINALAGKLALKYVR